MRARSKGDAARITAGRGRVRIEHGLVGALLVVVAVALFDTFSGSLGALARGVLRNF